MPGNYFGATSNPEYSQFIHRSRYARWLEDKNRRETWEETVDRYIGFWKPKYPHLEAELEEARSAILNLEVMPSMRALMAAGKALERDAVAGFNCSFISIDHPKSFDEILYILCCGTGVGFSVERQHINKLPEIAEEFFNTDTTIVVADSKIGWATAFRELIQLLYAGKIPKWDLSKVRQAGARLKTFGGRASGPEPLDRLFKYTVDVFTKARGRKLTSLECHDVVCMIADIVIVGGVRRSALISLSNLSDDRMRAAKNGQWWMTHKHRRLANNSATYDGNTDFEVFLKEWVSLYESHSGERGIFNRKAANKTIKRNGRREACDDVGTNPCGEILLRPNEFCNLTEVIVRPSDTPTDLARKVRIATFLGTLQSSLTNFRYLRSIWKKNCEEERLLGVSMTGVMDHPLLGQMLNSDGYEDPDALAEVLIYLKTTAIDTNKDIASKIGINPSVAITCVKPSGTVSQLCDTASGIHPRFSPYYIRRVRADKKDPLAQFMHMYGFPCEEDVMNPSNLVFSFPIKAPEGAVCVKNVNPIKQLQLWGVYQRHWCEHNPSITVYYDDSNFMEVGSWVWSNMDSIVGISFLPKEDHVYQQAPYESISKEKFEEMSKAMPTNIDWSLLSEFEKIDMTTGAQELACTGGSCEVVDITGTV